MPGDSKWPFDSPVGGHLIISKGPLTTPKRSQRIARWLIFLGSIRGGVNIPFLFHGFVYGYKGSTRPSRMAKTMVKLLPFLPKSWFSGKWDVSNSSFLSFRGPISPWTMILGEMVLGRWPSRIENNGFLIDPKSHRCTSVVFSPLGFLIQTLTAVGGVGVVARHTWTCASVTWSPAAVAKTWCSSKFSRDFS